MYLVTGAAHDGGEHGPGGVVPAKPAFTRPEPLSHTRAVVSSSSHMSADSGGGGRDTGDECTTQLDTEETGIHLEISQEKVL